jgi:hypothetical protein
MRQFAIVLNVLNSVECNEPVVAPPDFDIGHTWRLRFGRPNLPASHPMVRPDTAPESAVLSEKLETKAQK